MTRRAPTRWPSARGCAMRQRRSAEALADLREADEIYARAQARLRPHRHQLGAGAGLLDAGDLQGAGAAADTAVAIETRIRVKSANPEVRARFLSASYAPYEARIEVDLAGGRRRITRPYGKRSGSPRPSAPARWRTGSRKARRAARCRAMTNADRLRERMTALQVDLERQHAQRGDADDAGLHETRRLIDEVQRASRSADARASTACSASDQLGIAESLRAVQAALPDDTAVLAYFVGDRRSHGWLLTRRELRHSALAGTPHARGPRERFRASSQRDWRQRHRRRARSRPC